MSIYQGYILDEHGEHRQVFYGNSRLEIFKQISNRTKVLNERFPDGPKRDFERVIISNLIDYTDEYQQYIKSAQ